MIERAVNRALEGMSRAELIDGMAICPDCGRPLCEPMSGNGSVAVWCRRCRKHILIRFSF